MTPPINSVSVDELAQEIRRIDGNNEKGAGELAEGIMAFLAARRAANTHVDPEALGYDQLSQLSPALPSQVVGDEPEERTLEAHCRGLMSKIYNRGHSGLEPDCPLCQAYIAADRLLSFATDAPLSEEVRIWDANQSCLTSPAAEPVAWVYELATRISHFSGEPATYHDFEPRVSFEKPSVPEGSIRNLRALHPSASREVTEADIERAARSIAVEAHGYDGNWEAYTGFARAALLAALPEREG